jgi:hypothetical protein
MKESLVLATEFVKDNGGEMPKYGWMKFQKDRNVASSSSSSIVDRDCVEIYRKWY